MFEYWMKTDVSKLPDICRITGHTFSQDAGANRIGAVVTNCNEPVPITGNIIASIIRADGETLTVSGEKDGNRAWIVLPESAYAVPGRIRIFLKVTDATGTATIGAAEGNVYQSMTEEVILNGNV